MRDESRDAAYLWDIVQTATKAVESVASVTFRAYADNEDLRLTVERRLEIIGEAARRLSPAFREAHPDVPWRGLIGLRNVMAHEYDEIDHERVWNVLKHELPRILSILGPLVPPPPTESEN